MSRLVGRRNTFHKENLNILLGKSKFSPRLSDVRNLARIPLNYVGGFV